MLFYQQDTHTVTAVEKDHLASIATPSNQSRRSGQSPGHAITSMTSDGAPLKRVCKESYVSVFFIAD